MSDTILRLIPVDPAWRTDELTVERVQTLLGSLLPVADEISARIGQEIEFVDAGENWGEIRCPACNAPLEDDWWSDQMEAAAEGNFTDLRVTAPCCGAPTSLGDLRYEWPVGFARVVVEAQNPGRDLALAELEQIERVLGCKLRKVWAQV